MSAEEPIEKTETDALRPELSVPRYRLVQRAPAASSSDQVSFAPISLAPGITYVGRVDDNDVVVGSTLVSRRHAKIILTDMGVTVHDLDSHNGVFLNGKKVRSTPLAPGDLVYFADVCCTLEPDEGGVSEQAPPGFGSGINESSLLAEAAAHAGSDDPAVKSLGALIRATDLVLDADDARFYAEIMQLCRELVEAHVAALLQGTQPDALEATVVLHEGEEPRGDVPLRWPVVSRAVAERMVLFTHADEVELALGDNISARDDGAVLCVPILVEGAARGAIYLSRPAAAGGFLEREVETLSAIAHLVGVRLAGRGARRLEEMDTNAGAVAGARDAADEEARAAVVRLGAELEELRGSLATAEQRAAQIAPLENALSAAERARDAALEEAHGSAEEAKASGERGRSYEEQARAVEEHARSLEQAKVALEEQLRAHADEKSALEEAAARAEQRARELEQELAEQQGQLEPLRQQAEAKDLEIAAARNEMTRLKGELVRVEEDSAASVGVTAALAEALDAALPASLSARVRSLAEGEEEPGVMVGSRTALCVGIAGFDAWAASASPDDLKGRLDTFCSTVAREVGAHGGAVEQVLGHVHLALFDGGPDGADAALRCSLALMEAMGELSLQGGVHAGAATLGFFGDGAHATRVTAGEVVVVARGASESAPPGAVYVSEGVRALLTPDDGRVLINCGPHILRGMPRPLNLYQLARGSVA